MSTDPISTVSTFAFVGMAGDPLGKWNLTMTGYSDCLKKVMAWKKPLLVLGGGEYRSSASLQAPT
jgi:histone deacetylase 8